jgi:hypothetical protein
MKGVCRFDFDKKTLVVESTFPELRMPGNYKVDGTILLFPVKGEGTGQTTMSESEAF